MDREIIYTFNNDLTNDFDDIFNDLRLWADLEYSSNDISNVGDYDPSFLLFEWDPPEDFQEGNKTYALNPIMKLALDDSLYILIGQTEKETVSDLAPYLKSRNDEWVRLISSMNSYAYLGLEGGFDVNLYKDHIYIEDISLNYKFRWKSI